MRKVIFITCCMLLMGSIMAQGRYDGQTSIGGNIGISDDGWYTSVNVQRMLNRNYFVLRADLIYADQEIETNINIPDIDYKQYLMSFKGGYSLEKFLPHPIYGQIFLGGTVGLETVNQGEDQIEGTTIILEDTTNVIYGFSSTLEVECQITPKMALTGEATQYYRWGSDIGNTSFYLGGGLKIYIN